MLRFRFYVDRKNNLFDIKSQMQKKIFGDTTGLNVFGQVISIFCKLRLPVFVPEKVLITSSNRGCRRYIEQNLAEKVVYLRSSLILSFPRSLVRVSGSSVRENLVQCRMQFHSKNLKIFEQCQ